MSDQKASSSEQKLAELLFADRRKERRWRMIRFFAWILILLIYAAFIFAPSHHSLGSDKAPPYVGLIRLNGTITSRRSFSARRVIPELNAAFHDKKAKGVVLLINSPGGSPVQSDLIFKKIMQLKHQTKKKIIVVAEDSLASGAYLVASAADKIYVDEGTLTGSIGVVMSGFGFEHIINKLGITRRVFTAGQNKARLDPFEPLKPQDVTKVKKLLDEVHNQFIHKVLIGRGKRLTATPSKLFSGDFWTGESAVKLGLADGIADLSTALEIEFKVKHTRDYSFQPPLLSQLMKQFKMALTPSFSQHIQLKEEI